MKILIFSDAANSHIEKWLHFFKERKLDIEIVTLRSGGISGYPEHILSSKTYRLRKSNRDYNRTKVLFEVYPQLKKIVNKVKPDIIHAHSASSYGLFAALTGFHPFILTVWGTDITNFPTQSKLKKLMTKFILKKADILCSTSDYLAKMTSSLTTKQQYQTNFGVDTETFKPQNRNGIRDKRFIFGTVKSLYKNYGIDYLIKAAAIVNQELSDWELWIGGEGTEKENLQDLAEQLQLSDKIKFLGQIPHSEVPLTLTDMDVFIVPSLEESFGVAAAEASACELPVICSNIGGLPEIVKDSRTGYVVEAEDAKAIAEKILHLYRNPELRRAMGKAGREFIKDRYEWQVNAEKMLTIYERAMRVRK